MKSVRRFSPGRVIDARERAGLTQAQAAQKAGISRATLQNAEGGRNVPALATVEALVGLYGCSFDWLVPEVEAEPDAPTRRAHRTPRETPA